MTDQEPERILDEPASEREVERNTLTTADLAAAGTVPAKTKVDKPSNSKEEQRPGGGFDPLFHANEAEDLRSRWFDIQARFVDEPRHSVEEADQLVATVMKRLAEVFAGERQNLEKEWGTGDDVSTEQLRVAFTRYRSFFDRLLSV